MGLGGWMGRTYFQFIILLVIGAVFAYPLNYIFSIDIDELRIMMSSIFLAVFSLALLIFKKI